MSNAIELPKSLEVKIRPYSSPNYHERIDLKGVSRVHLCKEALLDLNLESGQVCYLWKINETEMHKREAVAWLTSEKSLSKKVIQISKTFQEICGFKLGDQLVIQAAGELDLADSIILRDKTTEDNVTPELEEFDRPHWEWYIREYLGMHYL